MLLRSFDIGWPEIAACNHLLAVAVGDDSPAAASSPAAVCRASHAR
jgi:hypothetical protein